MNAPRVRLLRKCSVPVCWDALATTSIFADCAVPLRLFLVLGGFRPAKWRVVLHCMGKGGRKRKPFWGPLPKGRHRYSFARRRRKDIWPFVAGKERFPIHRIGKRYKIANSAGCVLTRKE